MKIAIVYDWLDKWGGVERLLLTLHEMYPHADWYTSFYDEKAKIVQKLRVTSHELGQKHIHTSFMQHFPSFIKKSRILSLPFFPFTFESMDLKRYDLVISVTSSFAKGVVTHPDTTHVCILLTPTRWLYNQKQNYELRITNGNWLSRLKDWIRGLLIQWDQVAAERPDHYIAISKTVAERCDRYYSRKAEVVYPPFDQSYWQSLLNVKSQSLPSLPSSYFLVVSRLEPYKRVDLVVHAFNSMPDKTLIIVGKGTQQQALKEKAQKNIHFLTDIDDLELAALYARAEALVMPQEEDFGYVSLEAQACGCPVISYGRGGARETIIEGKTGKFFQTQTVEALREAVADFRHDTYNLGETKALMRFSTERFKKEIMRIVSQNMN